MRRITNTVITLVLSLAVVMPLGSEARGRRDGGTTPTPATTQKQPTRPTTTPNTNVTRPGGNGGGGHTTGPNVGTRPGNGGGNHTTGPNVGATRPGGNGGGNHTSGPNVGTTRPGGGHDGGARPHNPNPGHRPDNRPPQGPPPAVGGSHHFGHVHPGVPHRPMLPPVNPWTRPVPPPTFRPYHHFSPFHTILGITLGTALDITINSLINSGYTVQGYNNNCVYLTGVNQLNMYWPNATLYYNGGGLASSEYVYSTPGYDMTRYNLAYGRLVSKYGVPYSVENTSTGVTATWWGLNGQFIRLTYQPDYATNGTYRYYTVLSFGN